MVSKIVASLIFACCLLAISLSLLGVTHIDIGKPFLSLMQSTSIECANFKIAIPEIPIIEVVVPQEFTINNAWDVLQYGFYQIVATTRILDFLNGLVTLINFVIKFFNVIIGLVQFVFILLKNIIVFRDTLVSQ